MLYLPEKARYDWIMQEAALSRSDLTKLITRYRQELWMRVIKRRL
ncbi:MAG: hypothetical protein OJF52_002105 [Nitrospira sp.]|nr:MAG: hypothetical protein OJF52_002105 [Nitrospira sp.]